MENTRTGRAIGRPLVGVLVLCACVSPSEVPSPPGQLDLAFVVIADRDGVIVREPQGPFEYNSGLKAGGAAMVPSALSLPDGHRALVVGWNDEALIGIDPFVSLDHLVEARMMRVSNEPEECLADHGVVVPQTSTRKAPITDPVVLALAPELEATDLVFDGWLLELPLIEEPCPTLAPASIEPFARDPSLFEGVPTIGPFDLRRQWDQAELRGVLRIDEDRVLIAIRSFLIVAERGRPFDPETTQFHQVVAEPNAGNLITTLERLPDRGDGIVRAICAGRYDGKIVSGDEPESGGFLIEVEVSQAGLTVGEPTLVPGVTIDSFAVEPSGQSMVGVSNFHAVLTATSARGEITVDDDVKYGSLIAVTFSDDPVDLHLIGGSGGVWLGDATAGTLRVEHLTDMTIVPAVAGFRAEDGRRRVLAGNRNGRIFSRESEDSWDEVELYLPSGSSCISRLDCGQPRFDNRLSRLTPYGDRVFTNVVDCGLLYVFRPEDACGTGIDLGVDQEPLIVSAESDGVVFVGGTEGLLLELRYPE